MFGQSSYQVHQSSYYKTYEPSFYPTIPLQPLFVQSQRRIGKVKFFNLNKGYGFIIPLNKSEQEEVFVHHTSILSSSKGYLVGLNKGEEVEYNLCDGPKGIYALYVTGLKGIPIHCNPYEYNNPTTLGHTKSVIAYQPLYQTPYVTYIIPSTTTATAPPPYNQNSISTSSSTSSNNITYY